MLQTEKSKPNDAKPAVSRFHRVFVPIGDLETVAIGPGQDKMLDESELGRDVAEAISAEGRCDYLRPTRYLSFDRVHATGDDGEMCCWAPIYYN